MSKRAEAYMQGWKAGYHNATMAERKRILTIIKELTNAELSKQLEEAIKKKENENEA